MKQCETLQPANCNLLSKEEDYTILHGSLGSSVHCHLLLNIIEGLDVSLSKAWTPVILVWLDLTTVADTSTHGARAQGQRSPSIWSLLNVEPSCVNMIIEPQLDIAGQGLCPLTWEGDFKWLLSSTVRPSNWELRVNLWEGERPQSASGKIRPSFSLLCWCHIAWRGTYKTHSTD